MAAAFAADGLELDFHREKSTLSLPIRQQQKRLDFRNDFCIAGAFALYSLANLFSPQCYLTNIKSLTNNDLLLALPAEPSYCL